MNEPTESEGAKKVPATSTDQLQHELINVIRRYIHESDISCYTIIGCLEAIKADVLELTLKARPQS